MTLYPLEHPRTQSSLLVPSRFLEDFRERTEKTSREIYFHFLIKRYSPIILSGCLGSRETVKRGYQNPGQNLVKKNFNPSNQDWIQFDAMADYLGLSMTALFTLLLVLDIAGWGKLLSEKLYDRGVPPIISAFSSQILIQYQFPVAVHRKIRFKFRI
ncbi:MAG: DUF1564 domain-containing protein [Leptospira sp.]|nr:DUF1564 domain-containing protein [Leptospira sp.]